MKNYTILDHTADIGLEATGPTLRDAFAQAAEGMFALLLSAGKVKLEKAFSVEIHAASLVDLLVEWLNKLLYLYDAEKVVLGRFNITELDSTRLAATVSGEPLDFGRHEPKTYIKAATYHQAAVDQSGPCTVRVIFDV